jgi:phospholipase A1
MMVRNNFDSNDNRGALQLEWSFPLNKRIGGYIQYYLGYGESLIDYNHNENRMGLGFILMDWK